MIRIAVFILSLLISLSLESQSYAISVGCNCSQITLCNSCSNLELDGYSATNVTPVFFVQNFGSVEFYHGADVAYTGTDIAGARGLTFDYGDGHTSMTYPNVITSNNIALSTIPNYVYSGVNPGDILTVVISFTTDSGLLNRWTIDYEVPVVGTSSYGYIHLIQSNMTSFLCTDQDIEVIGSNHVGSGVLNGSVINYTYTLNGEDQGSAYDGVPGLPNYLTFKSEDLNIGLNEVILTNSVMSSTTSGAPMTSEFLTQFTIKCRD